MLQWTNECELAFKQMKEALLAEDVLLSYPYHTQPFHVYTDASDYQLGATLIMQNEHPLASFSCKISPAQAKYNTVMEKELLYLHVHTDRPIPNPILVMC